MDNIPMLTIGGCLEVRIIIAFFKIVPSPIRHLNRRGHVGEIKIVSHRHIGLIAFIRPEHIFSGMRESR